MNKTLTISLLLSLASAAGAQDSTQIAPDPTTLKAPLYRNPQKARVLSFIPGWGYAYTGEYLRGYGTWVMTFVGVTVGPIIFSSDTCGLLLVTECSKYDRVVNLLTGSLITIAGISTYVKSIRDAPRSAERANERHRRKELRLQPTVGVSGGPEKRLTAGVNLAW
ncbi:MAG TPA: hypothetical protein VJS39_00855 [Gemmatimonadaceae bacterium]|nr:hypothetical protein [Gemmatimonadaceae bacterium]